MEKEKRFIDYLNILYKWKKFIIINLVIVLALVSIYSFSQPNLYKSTSVVMLPPESSMGFGGLSSLIGGKSSGNLGTKLLGLGGNTSEDMILGILNSTSALKNVIEKYDLYKYYEVDDKNFDKTLKAFKGNLSFGPNEYGMIEISVTNSDANKAAEIANYFVYLLDSINIKINVQNATNNREFIEKRYLKNIADIKLAEDSLYKLQKEYGVFAIPQQLEVAIKSAAEFEKQLVELEISANGIKNVKGVESPEYKNIETQMNFLKSKIDELKTADKLTTNSNVLLPFKEMPQLYRQYYRVYREIEVQNTIQQFVLPMYEQARVEEQKSIPTVMVLDKAEAPQLKSEPKRAFFIGGIGFLSLFVFMFIVFLGEKYSKESESRNELDAKLKSFFRVLKQIYFLKF